MYRIDINWENKSPFLGVASGECIIIERQGSWLKDIEVSRFKVKKERSTSGYSNVHGIKQHPFASLRLIIDTMMHAYFDGMLLKDMSFQWIDEIRETDTEYLIVIKKDGIFKNHNKKGGESNGAEQS